MSLTVRLSTEAPRRTARDIKEDPRYQIALRYFDEITELRERGYTWGQINHAATLEAKATGLWSDKFNGVRAEEFYRKILKERRNANDADD